MGGPFDPPGRSGVNRTVPYLQRCERLVLQRPRNNFEIERGAGTISDSILGRGAQNTFSY